jgi:hypothetical protein
MFRALSLTFLKKQEEYLSPRLLGEQGLPQGSCPVFEAELSWFWNRNTTTRPGGQTGCKE